MGESPDTNFANPENLAHLFFQVTRGYNFAAEELANHQEANAERLGQLAFAQCLPFHDCANHRR